MLQIRRHIRIRVFVDHQSGGCVRVVDHADSALDARFREGLSDLPGDVSELYLALRLD